MIMADIKWFYSASQNGFYSSARFSSDELPEDAIEITNERRLELLEAQDSGKVIKPRAGAPAAYTVQDPSGEELLEFVKRQRRESYQLESDPLYLEWQYDQTEESEKAWREKVEEIKERYPLPVVS